MTTPDQLKDRVAVVTGAGGEIGGVITRTLLDAGAAVVMTGRNLRRLKAGARRLKKSGFDDNRIMHLQADVRVEEDVRHVVAETMKRFGRLDILVNNAGARGPTAPITKIKLEDWRETIDTNLTGAFLFSRECLEHMAHRRWGRMINISTVVSHWAYPLRAPYAASKAALNSLTLTLAQEAGRFGITVNALCPGPVAGEALDRVIAMRAETMQISLKRMQERFMRPSALGRAVTAEDVARAAMFLCSDGAQNITGQTIDVSAGYGLSPGM